MPASPDLVAWAECRLLAQFRGEVPKLDLSDRRRIVDEAIKLVSDYYVHLPLKQAGRGVDPAARLRLLRRRLPAMDSDAGFHTAISEVFDALGDLHTNYLLPSAMADVVAFLPFQLGEHAVDGAWETIVTDVSPGFEGLSPGDAVVSWSGVPMPRAVERAAARSAGANPSACRAQALAAMTLRPLAKRPPPDEDWVMVEPRNGPVQRVDWRVLTLDKHDSRHGASLDIQVDAVRRARHLLFPPRPPPGPANGAPVAWTMHDSLAPRLFSAATLAVAGTEVGYIRIHTFLTRDAGAFVAELVRLLALLPRRGLVLDIRSNGGGLVEAAERSLQLFTPGRVEPAPMQVRATPAALALSQLPGSGLERWSKSLARALETGAPYSAGLPLTPCVDCNDLGQHYHGPVVLLINALCYSAADIFAGGFQDHAIGRVLGVHATTGAGGANVWPLATLQGVLGVPPGLPHGAELRVAFRRTLRVGRNVGIELEERGVLADCTHATTRRDLLGNDADLLAHAAQLIGERPWRQLDVAVDEYRSLRVRLRNADRLDTQWNGRPLLSQDVAAGPDGCTVQVDVPQPGEVRLLAYSERQLVAARTVSVT